MLLKWVIRGLVVTVGAALVGGFVFGKELVSYAKSTARATQTAVRDSVPIEFELKRANDLLEEIIPEIHRNIKMIAQEEVEIAALKADLDRSTKAFDEEKQRIHNLRNCLAVQKVSYTMSGKD